MRDDEKVILEFFKWYGHPDRWNDDACDLISIEHFDGNVNFNWRDYRHDPDNFWGPPIPQPEGIFYFSVDCSDTFEWGSADSEYITLDNLKLFTDTVEEITPLIETIPDDANDALYDRYLNSLRATAAELFAARVRHMRPQGPAYSRYPKVVWPKFDACGPNRQTGGSEPHVASRECWDAWW